MKQFSFKSWSYFLFFLSLTAIFFACNKTLDPIPPADPNPPVTSPADLTTTVNTSVTGYVTDQNEAPVLNASVQVGGTSTTTDKYGFFQALNGQAVKNAESVKNGKTGNLKRKKRRGHSLGSPPLARPRRAGARPRGPSGLVMR